MPRKSKAGTSVRSVDGELGCTYLTSGDVARMLRVDLKTIHNWVGQGHIRGHRTKGRHLRFSRTEVVRLMRRYGYPVPSAVSAARPRVVVDLPAGSQLLSLKSLRRSVDLTACDSLFGCALAVASGEKELLVLDLDKRDKQSVLSFFGAIREWPASKRLIVVGISKKSASRRAFLDAGGDITLPAVVDAQIRNIARWLTGSHSRRPGAAELAAAADELA